MAQEGSKMAQDRSKMAQVGSKVGLQIRKVAKVKLLKNCWFLQCFGPPGGLKMTPGGPQMSQLAGHLDGCLVIWESLGVTWGSGDLPEGSRGLQEAPLDPPEAAKGSL